MTRSSSCALAPRRRRRWWIMVAALLCVSGRLEAQPTSHGTISVTGPAGSPLRDGIPTFTITTAGFQPNELPLRIDLQVATRSDFSGTLYADTTVTGSVATIVVPRLLPERVSIWWRVRAVTVQGALVSSDVIGPATTSPWLTLISPNGPNGSTLVTKRPTFLWSSVGVHAPVPPWQYQIVIRRSSDGVPVLTGTLTDTVFTSIIDLESNTSYRWAVIAKLATGDSTMVNSIASFVIADPNAPIATVLFQPFPNPFPTDRVDATCIWFDLRAVSSVQLEVLDLRGNHVARILPGRGLGGPLPPGRYGRAQVGSDSGCDSRLTWDGRDDDGRYVPQGVYLIRFRGDHTVAQRKVLWKGR